jgi:hypothetical protein
MRALGYALIAIGSLTIILTLASPNTPHTSQMYSAIASIGAGAVLLRRGPEKSAAGSSQGNGSAVRGADAAAGNRWQVQLHNI